MNTLKPLAEFFNTHEWTRRCHVRRLDTGIMTPLYCLGGQVDPDILESPHDYSYCVMGALEVLPGVTYKDRLSMMRELGSRISTRGYYQGITVWNDGKGMTKEDILEVLNLEDGE